MTEVPANMGWYDPVLCVSEAFTRCREPEQLASVLAQELGKLLAFDFLDVVISKEGTDETEWHAVGKGSLTLSGMPVEEPTAWHVYNSQKPLPPCAERVYYTLALESGPSPTPYAAT
jgi:hypothetical protein